MIMSESLAHLHNHGNLRASNARLRMDGQQVADVDFTNDD